MAIQRGALEAVASLAWRFYSILYILWISNTYMGGVQMRTIKFRAWHTGDNIFIEQWADLQGIHFDVLGEAIKITFSGVIHKSKNHPNIKKEVQRRVESNIIIPKEIKLMQFTGLLDKKGKEIYEGDIVKGLLFHQHTTIPTMGEIVFCEKYAAFALKNLGGETLLHNHDRDKFEIIGNIYENSELLK
jgi:uncharacterized phage protein (TIGR01671 family)